MKNNVSFLSGSLLWYNRMIFFLSIFGLLVAIYVLQSFISGSSIVCVTNGCELVRKSPYSYIFGIPVPGLGLVGYLLIAIITFLRTTSKQKILLWILLGVSAFGAVFVSWFTFMEIFYIKAICTWCAISAINMLVIGMFALKSFFLIKHERD